MQEVIRPHSDAKAISAEKSNMRIFWLSWVALSTSAFGFVVRSFSITQWGQQFNLTATQEGEIFGVGLWPFAISIILLSLFIDRIGYFKGLVIAWILQLVSVILTLFATGFWSLWIATFIFALGCGTVEGVVNPVIATLFKGEKTKWLNHLHSGWAGGLVIGGLFNIALGSTSWETKVMTILAPIIAYGIMMIGIKLPKSERVQAGISYKEMLKEAGILGCLIIVTLIILEIGRIFNLGLSLQIVLIAIPTIVFGFYVKTWGNWFFIVLLLIMIPSATAELATDSWITPLIGKVLLQVRMNPGWTLVYIAFIQMVLRFCAGYVLRKTTPLGIMLIGSAVCCIGLYVLSSVTGFLLILIAVTIYAVGKAYFWSTMLGLTSERVPKGGALIINSIGGMGMIAAGILGTVYFGYFQDINVSKNLSSYDQQHTSQLHDQFVTQHKRSVFGDYTALNKNTVDRMATPEQKNIIDDAIYSAKKAVLRNDAILPFIMFIAFLILIFYFKSRGGYKPVRLNMQKE